MPLDLPLDIRPEIVNAVRTGRPVVALESTLIAHGLPRPLNLETAKAAEAVVREEGAIPATIAVWHGRAAVGLNATQLENLATGDDIRKASRRDLAAAVADGATAATTVAATLYLAHKAGLRVFATGGLGGVHPATTGGSFDVSADLTELARIPIAVVCAGAKSILDLAATLERLETDSVPVVGYGVDTFPAFYVRESGLRLTVRVDTPEHAAALCAAHWTLDGAGVVIAQPPPAEYALDPAELAAAQRTATADAERLGVRGPALTPFLLGRLATLTQGRSLEVNHALILANARLAARLACALSTRGAEG
jgi:pseudouridine-5'-phosphate glycosidase